jgi:hypothetical protein
MTPKHGMSNVQPPSYKVFHNFFISFSPSLKPYISQQISMHWSMHSNLNPQTLTFVSILFFKPYASKRSLKFLANVCPIVSTTANKPIITYLVSKYIPKKL